MSVHVIVRACLQGLYQEYTIIPRAQPEGLRNITECIHEKARRRRALTSLYPGYEIITR